MRSSLRAFLVLLAAFVVAAVLSGISMTQGKRHIAVTFDDLIFVPDNDVRMAAEWTRKLTSTLRQNHVLVTAFVNEKKLTPVSQQQERKNVLKIWLDAGFDLGNHTYSHVDMFSSTPEVFERELVTGEVVTRKLMASKGKVEKFFRHPFLNTGPTLEVKAEYDRILAAHNYTVAPVTVDNSDYMFAKVYTEAIQKKDAALQKRVSDAYIPYMDAVLGFYEKQSMALFGREINQILLVHANPLNAEHFGEMIAMMKKRGYDFISLDQALKDPAYKSKDEFVGRSGTSWIQRWAITQKHKPTMQLFKDEPAVPDFIVEAYNRK